MKKILFAVMMLLLLAVPAAAFESYHTDVASLKISADQNQMGGTISATIPFYVDYFKVGHSIKVSGLEGVAMIGATGGIQDQDMYAKAKANGNGGYYYYYYYGYNSISWDQQQNQSGNYYNSFSGNGMSMKQCGSFNQNQYQAITIQAPNGYYY